MRSIGGWCVLVVACSAVGARAENYLLSETPRVGDCFRWTMETNLAGNLKVTREEKQIPLKIVAKNEHQFVEKTLALDKGLGRKSARRYSKAVAHADVDGDKALRTLSETRQLIVAQRNGEALLCYSPTGPLTRSELEVVAEHFDTQHLVALLPGKEVSIGDSWKISNLSAQALCLFDGLLSQELAVTLKEVTDGHAVLTVAGTAKGVEHGALATLTINATLHYELLKKRIVRIEWKQKDQRDQGPITPAAEVESTTSIKRDFLDEEPKELSRAALIGVPEEDDPPGVVKQLTHRDSKDRYQFVYGREWHIVAQTDHHLVLRLMERGDFVAQATVTMWKNAGAGKHLSVEEFQQLVSKSAGWQMEQVVDHGNVAGEGDRWAYRISAKGDLDGIKVIQNFFIVAAPTGEQVILTFTMKPANAARVGTRDLAIVNGIELLKK